MSAVAEKLQAVASPLAEWIRDLEQKHILVQGGLGDILKLDLTPGLNFQNLAHMVFLCEMLPTEIKLPPAPKVEQWLAGGEHPNMEFKREIDKALISLWQVASIKEHKDGFTKITPRLAPAELLAVCILLFKLTKEAHPLSVQAKAVYSLRKSIRSQFKNIGTNTRIRRAMWEMINKVCKDVPAQCPTASPPPPAKRKRSVEVESEDEVDELVEVDHPESVTPPKKKRGRPSKQEKAQLGQPIKRKGRPRKLKTGKAGRPRLWQYEGDPPSGHA